MYLLIFGLTVISSLWMNVILQALVPHIYRAVFKHHWARRWPLFRHQATAHTKVALKSIIFTYIFFNFENVSVDQTALKMTEEISGHITPRIEIIYHEDIVTYARFPRYWPFVMVIHWWPVDYNHKGPVMRYSDVFFLLLVWESFWTYSPVAGDLRRHDAPVTSLMNKVFDRLWAVAKHPLRDHFTTDNHDRSWINQCDTRRDRKLRNINPIYVRARLACITIGGVRVIEDATYSPGVQFWNQITTTRFKIGHP